MRGDFGAEDILQKLYLASGLSVALVEHAMGWPLVWASSLFLECFGGELAEGGLLSEVVSASERERLERVFEGKGDEARVRIADVSGASRWVVCERVGEAHFLLRFEGRAQVTLQGDTTSSGDVGADSLMRTVLDLLPNPVFVKDQDHRWILVNTKFCELLGVEDKNILGKSDYDVFPREQADHFWKMDEEVIEQGRESLIEEPLTTTAGEEKWLLTHKIPTVLSTGEVGLIGVILDITRRKVAEQQLLLNAELRDQAVRANQTKSRFLAHMSHELRTPLNAIIGYSELLLEDAQDMESDEVVVQDLGRIHDAAHRLLELISTVLDLSNLEAGKVRLHAEEFHLKDFVDELDAAIRPLLRGSEVDLRVRVSEEDAATKLEMDRLRFGQVALNLLSNAVKFTRQGHVELRARIDGEDVVLEVEDTGEGIAREKFKELFVPFERLEAETSTVPGAGLGLSLARYLCHVMGGDIALSSEVGEGTTFMVRLPLRQSDEDGVEGGRDMAALDHGLLELVSGKSGSLMLVIDDDRTVFDLFQRFASAHDVGVMWAPTLEQGVLFAKTYSPDMIALDAYLGESAGWTILEELSAEATRTIPVVLMTFAGMERQQVDGVEDVVMQKPISRTVWEGVASRYLRALAFEHRSNV